MAMLTFDFSIQYLNELTESLSRLGDTKRIGTRTVAPCCEVPLAYPGYGERTTILSDVTEMDAFDDGAFVVQSPSAYRIRDAMVRFQYGLVTVDGVAIRESTFHFPWHRFSGFDVIGPPYRETLCRVPAADAALELSDAFSVHAGIHENYYHWLVLFLGRINSAFLDAWADECTTRPTLLLPYFADAVQRDSAVALARHHDLPFLAIQEPLAIKVRRLIYPNSLPSGGLKPHPIIRESMDVLRRSFHKPGDYPKKIYVSRRDTENRRMVNEEEIENFLVRHGYAIIRLTGRSFAEQVNLFAHATHVIGPHGAGLTNIGFCDPSTRILEILMPSHLNWCYRRLAAALGLRYGFAFGELLSETTRYVNAREYRFAPGVLQAAFDCGF